MITPEKRLRQPPVVGTASLLTILTVLCLSCFAVLARLSAEQEYRLAEKTVRAAESAYEADTSALRELIAHVRAGEQSVSFSYLCGENASIEVEAEIFCSPSGAGTLRILRWQRCAQAGYELLDDSIHIWNGN